MIRQLFGGIVIGLMATVFAVSFASIIYSGSLSPSLDRGIGLTLLGAGLISGLGALLFSFRGTVMHPQDVTAILLAGGAAAIVASGTELGQDVLFATVAAMIALATGLAGLACILFGRLRLGFVARYLPYPVLGGFLTATGYLFFVGLGKGRSKMGAKNRLIKTDTTRRAGRKSIRRRMLPILALGPTRPGC